MERETKRAFEKGRSNHIRIRRHYAYLSRQGNAVLSLEIWVTTPLVKRMTRRRAVKGKTSNSVSISCGFRFGVNRYFPKRRGTLKLSSGPTGPLNAITDPRDPNELRLGQVFKVAASICVPFRFSYHAGLIPQLTNEDRFSPRVNNAS